MFKTLLHLLAAISMLVSFAGAGLWMRSDGDGDYLGYKRQRSEGRDWVQEEWSARSHGGRLVLASYRKTSAAQGHAKAQIRSSTEGFFWKNAAEKSVAEKAVSEKNFIDIQRKAPATNPTTAPTTTPATAPTTAPTTAPAAAGQQPPKQSANSRFYTILDETTPTSRTRGVLVPHWVFIAVTGGVGSLWFAFSAARRRNAGDGPSDRVPLGARVFSTAASISILLTFALGLAWAKSWYVGDRLSWRDPSRPRFIDVHSGKGELVVHFRSVDEDLAESNPDLIGAPNGFHWRQDENASVGYTPKTFCFEHNHQPGTDGANRTVTVAAPYWFLIILALVLPSWWLRNQKYGPIRVSSFGRPAARPKVLSIHTLQRPM